MEGITALKDLFAPIVGKINVPRFEIVDPKTQLYGDLAVFTYGLDEYGSDGKATKNWNATDVYRRVENHWRIIHTHWSVAQKIE